MEDSEEAKRVKEDVERIKNGLDELYMYDRI